MKVVFVEYRGPYGFNPCERLLNGLLAKRKSRYEDKFIALTPYSVDQFQRIGFEDFSIPEDYYLWEDDDAYGEWFRGWLQKLEEIVVSYHPYFADLDLPLTTHCMTMLKNVMDAYVRTALQYFEILKTYDAMESAVLTGSSEEPTDVVDDELYFKHPSVYYRLIKGGCKVIGEASSYRRGDRLRDWFCLLRFVPSWRGNKTLLFAAPMRQVREAKLRGYEVGVLPVPRYWRKSSPSVGRMFPLFQSVDDEFGFPPWTSFNVLYTRVYHFLTDIAPKIEFYARHYERYFVKNRSSCLVFDRRNQLYQYGALIAARKAGLRTCYIRHGWDAYGPLWWRTEQRLRPFDYFVCPNELDVGFYRNLVMEEGLKVRIL